MGEQTPPKTSGEDGQDRQIIQGSQTNIAGDVQGTVLSGMFDGPIAVDGGEAIDLRGSQGVVYKPTV